MLARNLRPLLAALVLSLLPDLPAVSASALAAGPLDGPIVAGPLPRGEFRLDPGFDPDRPRAEAVMGKPNFVKVTALDPGSREFRLSRMVGQLWLRLDQGQTAWCTGFLVGPSLFVTNYHCLADMTTLKLEDVGRLAVAMEHLEQDRIGPPESQSPVQGVLKMDYELDYALLRLSEPLGERYGWLTLERDPAAIAAVEAVKIIQHPARRSKEIVLEETGMVKQTELFLHYLADTEGGSSGSPVFALDGETVIGLHHVGSSRYNEGVSMAPIAAEIAAYLPEGRTARAAPPTQAQPPADKPPATPTPVAAPAGGQQASVFDLLLSPAPPIAAGEAPVSLGLPQEVRPGADAPRNTAAAGRSAGGAADLGSGVNAGEGGTGLMKLNFD